MTVLPLNMCNLVFLVVFCLRFDLSKIKRVFERGDVMRVVPALPCYEKMTR